MKGFIGKIENGKIQWNNKLGIKMMVQDNEGKYVRMSLMKEFRTTTQNNLYWVFLGKIADETGNEANDLHEYAKRIFLPPKFINVNGKEIKIPGSTTNLSKTDFSDYMDRISAWSGVPIPRGEEVGYISNY